MGTLCGSAHRDRDAVQGGARGFTVGEKHPTPFRRAARAGAVACGLPPRRGCGDLHASRVRQNPQRHRAHGRAAGGRHRHHIAGRLRLYQSRRVGEPARAFQPQDGRGRVPEAQDRVCSNLDGDTAGTTHRTRHRREQSLPQSCSVRPVCAAFRRTPFAHRHPLRPVHRARPRCAELRLLPGCALSACGDAVGRDARSRRRRAPVGLDAADRHGSTQSRFIRARVCRRTRRADAPCARTHAGRRWRQFVFPPDHACARATETRRCILGR
ncbi:MAG: hypothetical protein FD124_634 [Alphaproteobacteria bacterium]|nr:MAG: hypothetical protein FD124_634 [Alphaproteobacteria bacterium]